MCGCGGVDKKGGFCLVLVLVCFGREKRDKGK